MAQWPLREREPLAVAVSGGADSLALALLAKDWADTHGHNVQALVVDHGLRAESQDEATQTCDWLAQQGIASHVLRVELGASETAIQERAREARYDAMARWCAANGMAHVLLGHQREDQAETVLFRLLRGSAPEGLAGMAAVHKRLGITWLRPLLGVSKTQLQQYLRWRGQGWIEDPSNQSMRYLRVRLRRFLEMQGDEAVQRLAAVAEGFGRYRAQQEAQLQAVIAKQVRVYAQGFAQVQCAGWEDVPDALAQQVMLRVLMHVNGGTGAPRSDEVARLHAAMRGGGAKRTLHACVVEATPEAWLVMREARALAPPIEWSQTGMVRWDRFELSAERLPAPCRVAALGAAGWRLIRDQMAADHGLPRAVIEALPALWHLDAVLCVPHMGYVSAKWDTDARVQLRFCAAKPLAAPPFWVMNREAKI
jgi:tRNA(Ile)-lysidine synthase